MAPDAAPQDGGGRRDGGYPRRTVYEVTEECRRYCTGGAAVRDCARECILRETGAALSEPCADCFAGMAACTVETGCSAPCDLDYGGDDCYRCVCGFEGEMRNCGQEFRACAGFARFCPVVDVVGPESCMNDADMEAIVHAYYPPSDAGIADGGA